MRGAQLRVAAEVEAQQQLASAGQAEVASDLLPASAQTQDHLA